MRLIDGDALIAWIKESQHMTSKMRNIICKVETMPSADRPQGEWIKFGLGRGTRILFCTNCERRIEVPLSQGDSNYDFCPNCGAKMKGEDDGEDIQSEAE